MALALSAKPTRHGLRTKDRVVKVVASGNYVTGGDTVDLTNVSNPNFLSDQRFGQNSSINDYEVVQAPAGYTAELVPGATLATWKLMVFSAPNTQLAAAAYPAAITGDFFILRFTGPKATV